MTISAPEAAEIALRMVREAPLIVFDTETSGVDWKRNYPIGYVVAVGRDSVYVPIRHGGGGNLSQSGDGIDSGLDSGEEISPQGRTSPTDFELALGRAFIDRNRLGHRTVGHNIKFDCHFAANAGVFLGRVLADTQIYEALLDEYARGYSLEACANRHGVAAKKGTDLYEHLARQFGGDAGRKQMENFWRTSGSDPLVVDYATGDGVTTWELYHAQMPLLEAQDLQVVRDLEDRLIWTLFRMERRGVRIDVEYLLETRKLLEEQIEESKATLPADLNVRSGPQVKQFIEAVAGRFDYPLTEKGNPSFPEKWLKTFPEGRAIVNVRSTTNLINSFMTPLIETHIFEGRVHANFNQLKSDEYGTAARLSCNAPNLQQVPKRKEELAKLFRRAFIADEGMLFFEDDYSQCEPRLFGHYSGEKAIIEGYQANPPRDMHQVVADMLNVERDPTAKRMNMGLLTGLQVRSFAEHMDWDMDRATDMHRKWMQAFPGIKHFQDEAKRRMKIRKFVKTLIGRRGRMDHPRFAYRGTSKIIQGTNADILKWKMVEIDQYLESYGDAAQLTISVHDSFNGQIPDTLEGRKIHRGMIEIMEDVQTDPFNLRLPFKVDSGIGTNWGEASFGK